MELHLMRMFSTASQFTGDLTESQMALFSEMVLSFDYDHNCPEEFEARCATLASQFANARQTVPAQHYNTPLISDIVEDYDYQHPASCDLVRAAAAQSARIFRR